MSLGMGYNSWIGFATEGVWGTEASRLKFLELVKGGDGLDVTETPALSDSIRDPGIDTSLDFAQGSIIAGGPLTFEVPEEGAEVLFLHALGAVATTNFDITNHPTLYQHIFTVSDALQSGKGLSIEVNRDAASFIYTGCKINSVEFSIALNGRLRCAMGVIAKDGNIEPTPATYVAPTKRSFVFTEGALTWGVTAQPISAATITLSNNLENDRRFVGSRYISEPVRGPGKMTCTFSMTVEFDSVAQYNDFRAATSRALQLVFTGDTVVTGHSYTLTFDILLGRLLHAVPLISDEGRIVYEISGQAFRNTSYKELQLTVLNTVSSVA